MERSGQLDYGGEVQGRREERDHWRGVEENLSHPRQIPSHNIHPSISNHHTMVNIHCSFVFHFHTFYQVSVEYCDAGAFSVRLTSRTRTLTTTARSQ